jgi:hypothetical protein
MLLLLLAACIDLTQFGAYSCDEYCEQILDKTEECALVAAEAECIEAGGTDCSSISEDELSSYVSGAREDWADASRNEMVNSCKEDIASSEKTDAACQAETATINNLTCDQILDTLGGLAGAAG